MTLFVDSGVGMYYVSRVGQRINRPPQTAPKKNFSPLTPLFLDGFPPTRASDIRGGRALAGHHTKETSFRFTPADADKVGGRYGSNDHKD